MGNLLYKKEVCKESNDVWFNDLKKWENKIKMNNYLINQNTNNKPDHINILNEWVNEIKLNNFIKNNNTNNPPDYVFNLKNENYNAKNLDLSNIKIITSTGSPLASESFKYVYEYIKSDVHLASIAGGTDLVGCLILGNLFIVLILSLIL